MVYAWKRLWRAVAAVIVAAALLILIGDRVARVLATSDGVILKFGYCPTVRSKRCWTGSLVHILPYAVAAAIFVAIIVHYLVVIWRLSRELHIRAHGTRVPGVVVGITWLNRANEPRRIQLRVEVPGMPGVIAVKETAQEIPKGRQLMVAYDPARPGRAVVVDDLP
jgi:hypothetical protein